MGMLDFPSTSEGPVDAGRPAPDIADQRAVLDAIDRSTAIIEFETDGTIRHANENFLAVTGYRLDEIVGRHHRLFVQPAALGPDDDAFWQALARGAAKSGAFERFRKDGSALWIQASYNPIQDTAGRSAW